MCPCGAKKVSSCRVHEEQDLFAISGSLLEPGTGVSTAPAKPTAAAGQTTAQTLVAAVEEAAAAGLRAPFGATRPRAITATLTPVAAADAPSLADDIAASVATQHADHAAIGKADRTGDRPVQAPQIPNEDGSLPAHAKKKKRKRQHDMASAPASGAVPSATAAAALLPVAQEAIARANSTDAVPASVPRQHKKRRRDKDLAVLPGTAPLAAFRGADSEPQQVNGPVSQAAADLGSNQKNHHKRRRADPSSTEADAARVAPEAATNLANGDVAERKKRKKRKHKLEGLALVNEAELPNGLHSAASKSEKDTATGQQAADDVRTLPNGVMSQHDQHSLARKKHKVKRTKVAVVGLRPAGV